MNIRQEFPVLCTVTSCVAIHLFLQQIHINTPSEYSVVQRTGATSTSVTRNHGNVGQFFRLQHLYFVNQFPGFYMKTTNFPPYPHSHHWGNATIRYISM